MDMRPFAIHPIESSLHGEGGELSRFLWISIGSRQIDGSPFVVKAIGAVLVVFIPGFSDPDVHPPPSSCDKPFEAVEPTTKPWRHESIGTCPFFVLEDDAAGIAPDEPPKSLRVAEDG